MFNSLLEVARNSPFRSPIAPVQCEAESKSLATMAASTSDATGGIVQCLQILKYNTF